jgi:hypothetical protein
MEKSIGTPEQGKQVSRSEFNLVFGVVVGIAVVCGLGFITLLFNYYQQSAVSFENLKDQVLLQNQKIDLMVQQNKNIKK